MPKRVPKTLTVHGDSRVDEFYWLRERTNPEVVAHLEAENAHTRAVMAPAREQHEAIYAEMLAHLKQTDTSAPYRRFGWWYYSRTQQGQQYAVYCRRRESLSADEEVLLDLNELAAGKTFLGLGTFAVSDDGNLLAYATDDSGYRQYTLFVRDLRTGALIGEPIERVDEAVWAADNRTLVYATEDPVTKRADSVWRRAVAPGSEAALVYREDDELFDIGLERTRSGTYIMLYSLAKDTTEVRYLRADQTAQTPQLFAARVDGVRYDLDERDGRFYIRTNEDAPDFRVLTTPVDAPQRANWTELIPQRPHITITRIEAFRDFVALGGRRDGLSSIELLTNDSNVPVPLTFDEADYTVSIGQNAEFDTGLLRYTYESLVTPRATYDLDVASLTPTLVKEIEVPGYDAARYVAERVFVPAADGTPIPISLVRRRDTLVGTPAPLLLYAYGSYGISIDPTFSAARLPLLDRGMTFAIAHIRGGGEYGEAWRLAGNLSNKRTTFSDFIDCADGLIAAGRTAADRLVIQGASAGGLLMGAVVNSRPELFRAAVVQVPFVDVLTTMLDPLLPLTTSEYREWGNPNDADVYAYMRTYSPLDNVRAQPYPALLIEVSYNDSQTPYWEGTKFAAKVRSLTTGSRPILLKANMGAGHGGSSGRYDALHERAFDLTFVLRQVGITG